MSDQVNDPAAADDWAFGDGGFAKLYGDKLAESSLLDCAVATRWVFLFMLARADAEGRFRCASVSGLARAAAVSLEEAQRAVEELEAPDPDSTTKDDDGRRLVRIPGGWQLVTHALHREFRSPRQIADAQRQQRHREKERAERDTSRDVTVTSAPDVKRQIPDTKRKTEERTETDSGADAPAPGPPPPSKAKGNGTDATKHPKATTTATTGGRVLSVDVLPPGDPSSWSREAADDWEAAYEGKPPGAFFGQLKPIVRRYGWERVRPALGLVLAETPVEYLNIPKVLGGSFEALERRLPQGPRVRGQRPTGADGDRDALAAWAKGTAP